MSPPLLCAFVSQTKEKALREEMAANKQRQDKENAKARKGVAKPKKVSRGEASKGRQTGTKAGDGGDDGYDGGTKTKGVLLLCARGSKS